MRSSVRLALVAIVAVLFSCSRTELSGHAVVINGTTLSAADVDRFANEHGMRIPPGEYWYDRMSGAWGVHGGPTIGFTLAGMDLGGALQANASGGGTGVFVNGRDLHPVDVAALSQLVPVVPGRYWVDAFGNVGYEGNPTILCNLVILASARGGSGGAYQRRTAGGYIGGDGSTSYFFDPQTGSSVMTGN
ncbi:MAG: hypothetical protein HYR85_24625 [Planctomycetes bacterium]|nr:hypothetical protein [Planctomycetota bacterium]MBI3847873.1 hypothetical protein [Planctomycetota bacterium]